MVNSGEIHRYYQTREKNPLKKMQSVVAIACKVLRVFYAILTKGVDYDRRKDAGRYQETRNECPGCIRSSVVRGKTDVVESEQSDTKRSVC